MLLFAVSDYEWPSDVNVTGFHSSLLQDDFHVENFVVECRRKVQLEMLRNDLHVYLKILQSAMVELINKDYADFVNLSTNLVCYCVFIQCEPWEM